MKPILMHICCGPCSLFPIKYLRNNGYDITGYFYNPNIHPFQEFKKRLNSVEIVSEKKQLKIEVYRRYELREFLRLVVFHEDVRCDFCVDMRLEKTAQLAKKLGIYSFTTTLLYSKYQNHDYIKFRGNTIAEKYSMDFVYKDFRIGWQEGVKESIDLGLYRQPYCGCVYSEQERYDKVWRSQKANKKC